MSASAGSKTRDPFTLNDKTACRASMMFITHRVPKSLRINDVVHLSTGKVPPAPAESVRPLWVVEVVSAGTKGGLRQPSGRRAGAPSDLLAACLSASLRDYER